MFFWSTNQILFQVQIVVLLLKCEGEHAPIFIKSQISGLPYFETRLACPDLTSSFKLKIKVLTYHLIFLTSRKDIQFLRYIFQKTALLVFCQFFENSTKILMFLILFGVLRFKLPWLISLLISIIMVVLQRFEQLLYFSRHRFVEAYLRLFGL